MPTSQPRISRVDLDSNETRPVLQPTCNRVVPTLDRRNSLKKLAPRTPPPPPPPPPRAAAKSPTSPKLRSPRPPATKRLGSETNGLTSSSDRIHLPKSGAGSAAPRVPTLERKKSKKLSSAAHLSPPEPCAPALTRSYSSSLITEAPGSFAAVRREQVALQCAQRKMKIAHYGRSKSAKYESVGQKLASPLMESLGSFKQSTVVSPLENTGINVEEKRCTFITPNSDPLYVAYHDEEWGVPAQDDKILFEMLVLSGAQVGSDWTSILKKRQQFRNAFSEFDAEVVANLTEKQITSISSDYGIDIARTRGVVDNANRILEVKKEFGSLKKYIWGFVNNKPICPQYKFSHKIPVKTSKSESISKDMQRRGFRSVGPTIIHSFMQAAGLTNDHLITCYRQLECTALTDQLGFLRLQNKGTPNVLGQAIRCALGPLET
ncbi:hypothetical protein V2J09_001410 [Rumex salicifolius]